MHINNSLELNERDTKLVDKYKEWNLRFLISIFGLRCLVYMLKNIEYAACYLAIIEDFFICFGVV